MKLRLKFVIVVATGIIVTIVLLVVILLVFSNIFLHGYTHVDLKQISLEAEKQIKELDMITPDTVQTALNPLIHKYMGIEMELFSQDGQLVYSSFGRSFKYSFEELASRFTNQPYALFTGEEVNLIYDIHIKDESYFLLLTVAGEALLKVQIFMYFNQLSAVPFLIVPLILSILLPILFVALYIVSINRRINNLNLAMQQTNLHALSTQVQDASKDEIGQLARLFNAMSEKLRIQFTRMQQVEKAKKTLISNLSHDFRTPLATIQGYAETLQRGKYSDRADIIRYSTIITQKSQYMDRLLKQLFEISTLDQNPTTKVERCNICSLVQQIVMEYALILEDKQFMPDIQIPNHAIWVAVDEQAIGQAVRNVIDNAIHYGGAGGYLGVEITEYKDVVRISIMDRGKGIASDELGNIFERFYRIEKGRKSDGMGVGLSIAHEIVTLHQGQIQVESEPFVLTVFTIELPLLIEASST